jgi:WD40 repeat protein
MPSSVAEVYHRECPRGHPNCDATNPASRLLLSEAACDNRGGLVLPGDPTLPPFVGLCRFQFALPFLAAIAFAGVGFAAPPSAIGDAAPIVLLAQPTAPPVTLKGHTSWVGGVAFSPDGKTIATASADGTVKFWDSTGKLQETLKAHDDIVAAVAFSKDGTHFATASFDGTAKVWTAKRELLHTLRGHRGAVLSVAFNPNGRALATGGIDGTVRVWELEPGKVPEGRIQRTHSSWVNAVTYQPDGLGLASVSSDNEIRFNPGIGKLLIIRPKLAEIRSVAYSADGKWLATGTRYGITKVWDNNGDAVATLKGQHTGDVWAVAFSSDGKSLAVGDGDWNKPSDIVLHDTTTWKERTRLKHTNEVLCIAWHPKKPVLAAGAWDKTAKVWDLTELLK